MGCLDQISLLLSCPCLQVGPVLCSGNNSVCLSPLQKDKLEAKGLRNISANVIIFVPLQRFIKMSFVDKETVGDCISKWTFFSFYFFFLSYNNNKY